MRSKKSIVVAAMAIAIGSLANPMETAAATSDQAVNVAYDSTTIVPDPNNPNTPIWGVSLQGAITFLDAGKTQAADIVLVGVNGHNLDDLPDTLNIEVKVKSTNAMKLELAGTIKDPVEYTLEYGNVDVTGTEAVKVAELTKTKAAQAGTMTLTGIASVKGSHKDILTYTIEGKTVTPPVP